jgi:hypothetical protein
MGEWCSGPGFDTLQADADTVAAEGAAGKARFQGVAETAGDGVVVVEVSKLDDGVGGHRVLVHGFSFPAQASSRLEKCDG